MTVFNSRRYKPAIISLGCILLIATVLNIYSTSNSVFEESDQPKTTHKSPTVPAVRTSSRSRRHVLVEQENLTIWTRPVVPDHLQSADQDNEELIQHIRDHWIIPPYPVGQWKIRKLQTHYSEKGQSEAVDKILDQKRNGFFIECGASDGQFLSNSLFFEKSRNWTGLLVEANPMTFTELIKVQRHAYMINACLSPTRHPMVLNYTLTKAFMGGLSDFMSQSHQNVIKDEKYVTGWNLVQCFPLAAILKAINVKQIDYFSLDIEGAELEVLKTIPFNELDITAFTIEFLIQGDPDTSQRRRTAMERLLIDEHGYEELAIIKNLDMLLKKKRRAES